MFPAKSSDKLMRTSVSSRSFDGAGVFDFGTSIESTSFVYKVAARIEFIIGTKSTHEHWSLARRLLFGLFLNRRDFVRLRIRVEGESEGLFT